MPETILAAITACNRVAECHLQGLSDAEISSVLAMPLDEVRTAVRKLRDAAEHDFRQSVRVKRQLSIQTYRMILRKAMDGWERSVGEKRKVRKTVRDAGFVDNADSLDGLSSPLSETQETEWDEAGDPRFLDSALKAQARIDAIEGNDAPQKVALTDTAGGNIFAAAHAMIQTLPPEQLAAIEKAEEILFIQANGGSDAE